jgi:hypothetical protein
MRSFKLADKGWLKGLNHSLSGHFGNPSIVFNHGVPEEIGKAKRSRT